MAEFAVGGRIHQSFAATYYSTGVSRAWMHVRPRIYYLYTHRKKFLFIITKGGIRLSSEREHGSGHSAIVFQFDECLHNTSIQGIETRISHGTRLHLFLLPLRVNACVVNNLLCIVLRRIFASGGGKEAGVYKDPIGAVAATESRIWHFIVPIAEAARPKRLEEALSLFNPPACRVKESA